MTLAQIRTQLRRLVHDVPKVEWPDDAELDEYINIAYAMVQKEIRKAAKDAHLFWDYMNLVAGTSWYPLPSTFAVRRVGLKLQSTDLAWVKADVKDYDDIYQWSGSGTYVTIMGQWIGIFPAPANSVTSGIELIHNPIMALAGDADVPRIKLPLHPAIALWAKLLLLGETDETVGETKSRLSEFMGDIPNWYSTTDDLPQKLSVSR